MPRHNLGDLHNLRPDLGVPVRRSADLRGTAATLAAERVNPLNDRRESAYSQEEREVGAGGLKPNTWERFERLGSTWELARLSVAEDGRSAVESEPGVVSNPGRRARTPLTESEVDAI